MYRHTNKNKSSSCSNLWFYIFQRREGICTKKQEEEEEEGRGGSSSQVYKQIWEESFLVVRLTIMVTVGA